MSEFNGSAQPVEEHERIVGAGIEQALRYAALSGPFYPVQALRTIDRAELLEPDRLTEIAAGLSQACDRSTTAGAEQWLMRGAERRRTLDGLARSNQIRDAVVQRRETAEDQATQDLLNAIEADGIFSAAAVSAALGADPDRDTLQRLAVGLGRAGPLAPEYEQVPRIKAALTNLDLVESAAALRGRNFPGREDEVQQLTGWLEAELSAHPATVLYVEGLPGIGKTSLLDQVAAALIGQPNGDWVVVRLDFDRAGLDVQDMVGLTLELARQVSAQVPGAEQPIQQARHLAASALPGASSLKGGGPELVPEDLAIAVGNALTNPRRHVLLILDTLEVLRGRGETHPGRLFDWLDQIATLGQLSIAVVGAGRGGALDSTSDRVRRRLPLVGLDDASVDQLLDSLDVPPRAYATIRSIAQGNPLALRLAAKLASQVGPEEPAEIDRHQGSGPAYLYRLVMSRIGDPDLRSLASAGLVVRRISADLIRDVIGPQVGLRALSPERAEHLFQALAGEQWLIEPDPLAAGFVRHHADVRAVLLPLIYDAAPAQSARIDRAAATWFAARPESWCSVEAAYHRLQLMRRDPTVPPIDPSMLAQFDKATLGELPPAAQDVVRRNQGHRSTSFRGDRIPTGAALDPDAARELQSMNDRSDWLEGNDIYDHAFTGAVFDPNSSAADVALTFLWRAGRWSEARRLLDEQGGWRRREPPLSVQLEQSRLDAICRLEMAAEFDFDSFVRELRDDVTLRTRVVDLLAKPPEPCLAGAAVRFAVHRVGSLVAPRPTRVDAADAAIDRWRPDRPPREGPIAAEATSGTVGWDLITARTGPIDLEQADDSVLAARVLAVLTPFLDPLETASRLPGHLYVRDYAAAVQPHLNELGNLAPLGSPPWRDYVDTADSLRLRALNDVGLLAELAGAAAYVRRDRDLNLVARCADRWRRTVAGCWSYGRRAKPPGWDRGVDVTIVDRIAALVQGPDVIDQARAQLAAWCPEPPSEGDALTLLRTRAPRTIEDAADAGSDGDAVGAAAVLLARHVPSAFVPGVAVLLSAGHTRT